MRNKFNWTDEEMKGIMQGKIKILNAD